MTRLDRRGFLSGALSTLGGFLLPGCNVFAVPADSVSFGKPNLVFGVLSDTHLRRSRSPRDTPGAAFPTMYFRRALEYFRDQDVDAVMHCGDLAHRGLACELRFHADIWNKVFPKNKGRNGQPVEKLFVTGNHDWALWDFAKEVYPNEDIRKKKVLLGNMARYWQEIWNEPYERGWHKCVKGYHFFGEHWEDQYCKLQGLIPSQAKNYGLKGKKPFFVVQHRFPRAGLRKALRRFPNAVAFFGHWHQSNASEASIKFDSIPIIQCASLRCSGPIAPSGFKPTSSGGDGEIRQGLLVKVYDEAIVICRRDFFNNEALGPDWVMPLGVYKPHPLSPKELAKSIGEPAFASGAKLEVKGDAEGLVLAIPSARASKKTRAYAYDIAVTGEAGTSPYNVCVYAAGCDLAATSARACGPTAVKVAMRDLPPGATLKVVVRPVSPLGVSGKSLEAVVPRPSVPVLV